MCDTKPKETQMLEKELVFSLSYIWVDNKPVEEILFSNYQYRS